MKLVIDLTGPRGSIADPRRVRDAIAASLNTDPIFVDVRELLPDERVMSVDEIEAWESEW